MTYANAHTAGNAHNLSRHSKLAAALQFPGQKAWPQPVVPTQEEVQSASDIKFYLYTGGAAVASLMGFMMTAMAGI